MTFFDPANLNLYLAIAISVCNGVALCFCGYKFLQIIQLSGYKISGYWAWLKDTHAKFINRIIMLSFMSFACMLITATLFDSFTNTNSSLSYIGLIFYIYFVTVYTVNMYNTPKKTPLVQTYRMTRLCILLAILMAGFTFLVIALTTEFIPIIRIASIALTPLLLPIMVPLAHFIILPFELLNYNKYIIWAKIKLKKYPNLIKIGITGSYGKTSTKYILNTILSEKYSVCISPHSFNTPMGITKVILNYLKPNNDVLIVEMGANQIGEIRYLCDIINPKYGILTSVGNQHLATFGSVDNIKKTKNELIKSLPDDGLAIFNGDNKACMELYNECKTNKEYININNNQAFARAENIKISNRGISFKLIIDNNEIDCTTKLLGSHNLTNILMSASLAYNLGLSLTQIQIGISKLEPINNRLELRKENGLNILDDSYNSNVEGSIRALEVLNLFEKGNKIIVTPGLVELGIKEKEENINFGKNLSKVADYVIIVNKTNQESIKQGLLEENFNKENIFCVNTIIEAKLKLKEIAKKGDTILFENDLPDNYT